MKPELPVMKECGIEIKNKFLVFYDGEGQPEVVINLNQVININFNDQIVCADCNEEDLVAMEKYFHFVDRRNFEPCTTIKINCDAAQILTAIYENSATYLAREFNGFVEVRIYSSIARKQLLKSFVG